MFSIIIPTLNNLKYLKFCLNSIIKNSKLNNEIIVHVSEDKSRKTRDFLMENTVAYELRIERENVPQPTPPNITDPN